MAVLAQDLVGIGFAPVQAEFLATAINAAAATGGVTSVNGETGVVVLTAGDITNTASGTIAATNLQAVVNEIGAGG